MKIQINGEDRDCPAPLSLEALLTQLGMKADRVAVELNRTIVPREDWTRTALQEGDRLEIVHFVGGGTTAYSRRVPRQGANSQASSIPRKS